MRQAFSLRVWRALAFLSLIFGVSSCATSSSSPGWLRGDLPPAYSKGEFVSAVGIGENFAAAQIAAKSELARVFSIELKSEIELIDQETIVDEHTTRNSDLLVDTKISTQIELQGVEVPLHWRDRRTGEVWALAVLDRRRECLRIQNEGRDLIERQAAFASDSETDANPLIAIRATIRAVEIGVELDRLQARSRVLGNRCLTTRSHATGSLRAKLDRRLRRLSFVVTTQEVDPHTGESKGSLPQMREQIAGNLTKMGFQVGPAPGAQVVPVIARLRMRRVDRGTEWIEYRWEGSAEIGSPDPDAPAIIAAESEGAESHPESSTARLRARRKGEQALSRELDTLLKAFLADG